MKPVYGDRPWPRVLLNGQSCHDMLKVKELGLLLQDHSSCRCKVIRLVEHLIAIARSSMQKQDWRVVGLFNAKACIPQIDP